MICASLLAVALQSGMILSFPTGGEMVYRETWRITESDAQTTLTADAERLMRMRVKETTRGRTRFQVSFEEFNVRGADKGLNDDLRSWLEQPDRDQWVNDRGYVERKGEDIQGKRPFFGLVLPPPSGSMPDVWKAKLLPPIGSERAAEFEFRLDNPASELPILVSAKDKFGSTKLDVAGRMSLSQAGVLSGGDLTTTIYDSETKTTTVVEYRFQKR